MCLVYTESKPNIFAHFSEQQEDNQQKMVCELDD